MTNYPCPDDCPKPCPFCGGQDEEGVGDGVLRIAEERKRQIQEEGWDAEHDAGHTHQELAWAAVCYAAPDPVFVMLQNAPRGVVQFADPWPWSSGWDKRPRMPTLDDRIRMLEKAGALIAAEIDRLLDGKAKSAQKD
jgi:hypothetical protein